VIPLQSLAPNLWLLAYPLKMLGANLGRNVTIIRLASGRLIVHSTGPFSDEEVASIKALGDPAWIVEAMLRHDTFANEGRSAFPSARYLAPDGFSQNVGFPTEPLIPPPPEWVEEIEVASIDGAPQMGEVVMLHRPSRTLIVADLIFHFGGEHHLWTKAFLWLATVGGKFEPGMTLPFKLAIKDEAAYAASIRQILGWDFDRIIVGHGTPIESGGKEKLRATLLAAGVKDL
jgi:hypothetical protein